MLALVAPGAATDAVAETPPAAIEPVPGAPALAPDALAAPDGAIWQVAGDGRAAGGWALVATRVGAGGVLSRAEVLTDAPGRPGYLPISAPRPLADGGLGVVVARVYPVGGPGVAVDVQYVRVDAAGRAASAVSLPSSARAASAFTVEADGTVWWARACADTLQRRTASGSIRTWKLPRAGCSAPGEPADAVNERNTAVRVGADGAVWVANLCAPRVARLGADGRIRQWRGMPRACTSSEFAGPFVEARLAADPFGGIAWAAGLSNDSPFVGGPDAAGSGRISAAGTARALNPSGGTGFFDASGTAWQVAARISPDGETSAPLVLPDERLTVFVAPARGGAWVVGYRYGSRMNGRHQIVWNTEPVAQLLASDGSVRGIWALPPTADYGPNGSGTISSVVPGPDGALWVSYDGGVPLYRLTPPGLAPAAAPTATPTALVGRAGRQVALGLRCGADVGRWCRGTVRLGGAAKAVRFLVAGGETTAARLTLGDRAASTLRRRGRVATTAIVRSDGAATTTRKLTLRR